MFEQDISCPYCGCEIHKDWSNYITDTNVVNENRPMGCELKHTVVCKGIDCPECEKKFNVFGSVWEYPEGAFNAHNLKGYFIDD